MVKTDTRQSKLLTQDFEGEKATQETAEPTPSHEGGFHLKYLIVDGSSPEIYDLAPNIVVEDCNNKSELLEQWMQQRTIDLKASIKGLLETSKLPPEQWPAELRSLADEFDPKPKPLPLPDKAPELFAERANRRESIEDFLRRVWMPWIETGTLTRPAFAKLDQQGEMALRNWLRKNTLPPDIRLPTLKEVNDLALADTSKIREAERLAQIARRRRFLQQAKNTE